MRKLSAAIIAVMAVAVTWASAQTQSHDPTTPELSNPAVRLPAVIVTGTNVLQDELLLGDNQQPEWTARRPWVTTRVYVHPPWQMAVELGWDASILRQGKPTHLLQEEIELGLP